MPDTKRVTVLVGGVRAAAAIVDTTTVKMKTNRDGAQQGSAKCEIDDPINVNVSMFGEAGDTFSVDVSVQDVGDAKTRRGKLNDDFGARLYAIPLAEFEDNGK